MKLAIACCAIFVLILIWACCKMSSNCAKEEERQFRERCKERAQQRETITDGEKTMTLAELGLAICDSFPCGSCYDGRCPAAKHCRKGHNGALDWLREVIKNANE